MIYEALVKLDTNKNDNLSPQYQERILFQQGDIVVIRPRGWQWGSGVQEIASEASQRKAASGSWGRRD